MIPLIDDDEEYKTILRARFDMRNKVPSNSSREGEIPWRSTLFLEGLIKQSIGSPSHLSNSSNPFISFLAVSSICFLIPFYVEKVFERKIAT